MRCSDPNAHCMLGPYATLSPLKKAHCIEFRHDASSRRSQALLQKMSGLALMCSSGVAVVSIQCWIISLKRAVFTPSSLRRCNNESIVRFCINMWSTRTKAFVPTSHRRIPLSDYSYILSYGLLHCFPYMHPAVVQNRYWITSAIANSHAPMIML